MCVLREAYLHVWLTNVCACPLHCNANLQVKRKRMTSFAADQMMSQVTGVTTDQAIWKKEFSKADLVVEAVFESLELKHKVS